MSAARRRHLAAASLVVLSACGGGGGGSTPPAAPNAAAPASFTIVAGDSRQPVAGARVLMGGLEHASDAQGRVTFAAAPRADAPVDILSAGYFDRQTVAVRGGTTGEFTLWPRTHAGGLTEDFTNEVVYTSAAAADPVRGEAPLSRWTFDAGEVAVVYAGPGDDPGYLAFSPGALAVQSAAVDTLNGVGTPVRYAYPVPMAANSPRVRVLLRIYPAFAPCLASRETWGYANLREGGHTDAIITYCHERAAADLGLSVHEFGHTFGLRHSSDASDVMRAFGRRTARPSPREALVMDLMLQRPPGNRFPDNDRLVRAAGQRALDLACGP